MLSVFITKELEGRAPSWWLGGAIRSFLFVPWLWLGASWRTYSGWNVSLAPRVMSADNAAVHKWAELCCQMASGVKADTHKGAWPFTLVQDSCLQPYSEIIHGKSWAQEYGPWLYKINVSWLCLNWRTWACFWISRFSVVPIPRSTPDWGTVQVFFSNTLVSAEIPHCGILAKCRCSCCF